MSDSIKKPIVSVVIPTYNHARYLDQALQSVFDQTYTNWEIIVVDNHSTDNTTEIVNKYSSLSLTYLKLNNNGIIAASRNAALSKARGEWVAFLDSDDRWMKDKLQVCIESVSQETDFIYHDLKIDTNSSRYNARKTLKSWKLKVPILLDLLVNGNAIANSSVVVRKKFLHEIGGLNEEPELVASEDYNAWLRIALLTDKFTYIERILGYYLIHDDAVSKKDMSISSRVAVNEFLPKLSSRNKLKVEGRLRYISGIYNYNNGNYQKANNDLFFSLRHSNLRFSLRSFLVLAVIFFKKICI